MQYLIAALRNNYCNCPPTACGKAQLCEPCQDAEEKAKDDYYLAEVNRDLREFAHDEVGE